MTQVNFYALSSPDQESRRQFACRLAEKAAQLGHRVFIQVDSAEQAAAMDTLLWQFKPSSFVPHALAESAVSEPVSLALKYGKQSMRTCLLTSPGTLSASDPLSARQ